jgi:type IV pilus assembly protein PilF
MSAKFFLSALVILSLSACTSMHTKEDNKAAYKKVATAKINTQLGMAYLQKHDSQRAKQKFILALEQDPKLPEAWYSMGYYLEAAGDTEAARKYYQKSVDLAPKQGDVQNNFGTYLCRTGDYSGAVKHFMMAVADPEYLDTASAYENAGLCALKIPDQKLALKYFNRALTEDPNHPNALIEAARINYELKNYREAKVQVHEYLAIASPNSESIRLSSLLGTEEV